MKEGSFGAYLGTAQVSGLLRNLSGGRRASRALALEGLVRLPVTHAVWRRAEPAIVANLQAEDDDVMLRRIVEAAGRVPLFSVREEVRALADVNAALRDAAYEGLARGHDVELVPTLASALVGARTEASARQRAARWLAMIGDARSVDVLQPFEDDLDPVVRFWANTAASRAGNTAAVERLLGELEDAKIELSDLSDSPRAIDEDIGVCGRFPVDVVDVARDALGALERHDAREVARSIVATAEDRPGGAGAPEEAIQQFGPVIDDRTAEAIAQGDFAGTSGALQSRLVDLVIDPTSTLDHAHGLLDVADWLGEDFRPHVPVLFHSYWRAAGQVGAPGLRDRLGALASRAEPAQLLEGLNPALASPDWSERTDALQFLRDTAGYQSLFPEPPSLLEAADDTSTVFGPPIGVVDSPAYAMPPPERRVVSTGFADPGDPIGAIDPLEPLGPGRRYEFWFEIGQRGEGAIDDDSYSVPAVPTNARLVVVLFEFDGELACTDAPNGDMGALRVRPDGGYEVLARPGGIVPDSRADERSRLRFAIRTPSARGVYRLRCNLYYEQVLLQSRLVRVSVGYGRHRRRRALRAEVDYALAHDVDMQQLADVRPHRLSVLLNDADQDRHNLRVWVAGDVKLEAEFDARPLPDKVAQVRRTLRTVSWGNENEWSAQSAYTYADGLRDLDRLSNDLIRLARTGYELWDLFFENIEEARQEQLKALTREPGYVQFATGEAVQSVMPMSVLYDHPLDTDEQATLCPEFENAFRTQTDLQTTRCFEGQCPSYNANEEDGTNFVCPSGFWGFRHRLGLPRSIGDAANRGPTSAAHVITFADGPVLTLGVSTDPAFTLRPQHVPTVETLRIDAEPHTGENRPDVLSFMQEFEPHLMYFFCHGGVDSDGRSWLRVGSSNETVITRDNLRRYKICWPATRPLVFINGCETASVDPDRSLNFVSAFIRTAHASGVIGTEITVFESLACQFAEEFLRHFLVDGDDVGEAMRTTRLELLARGNPLGLVYIPFVPADLRLERATRA